MWTLKLFTQYFNVVFQLFDVRVTCTRPLHAMFKHTVSSLNKPTIVINLNITINQDFIYLMKRVNITDYGQEFLAYLFILQTVFSPHLKTQTCTWKRWLLSEIIWRIYHRIRKELSNHTEIIICLRLGSAHYWKIPFCSINR